MSWTPFLIAPCSLPGLDEAKRKGLEHVTHLSQLVKAQHPADLPISPTSTRTDIYLTSCILGHSSGWSLSVAHCSVVLCPCEKQAQAQVPMSMVVPKLVISLYTKAHMLSHHQKASEPVHRILGRPHGCMCLIRNRHHNAPRWIFFELRLIVSLEAERFLVRLTRVRVASNWYRCWSIHIFIPALQE